MKRLTLINFICFAYFLAAAAIIRAQAPLNLPLTVKETAGVGAQGYPITAVLPFASGQYYDVNEFRLLDSSGNTVPAQFDILNKWWAKDNSIRHLKIEFQPTVGAFTTAGTGISTYYLRDDGAGNNITTSLKVTDGPDQIEVNTGPLKFTISKTKFNIIDQLWFDQNNNNVFEGSEQIISSNTQNGGVFAGRLSGDIQYDTSRSDVQVTIEEAGPMRAVIKANALTNYYDTSNHTHGFAVRVYAYAGKPYVKIDYQLQNSAKNKKWSWPLYFEEMNLNFNLNLGNATVKVDPGDGNVSEQALGQGIVLKQKTHNQVDVHNLATDAVVHANNLSNDWLSTNVSSAFVDVSDGSKGVLATMRNFWQMFPSGLAIDSNKKLSFQLWPNWSCHWEDEDGTFIGGAATPCQGAGGLYWLEDMQHTYKESLLYFHNGSVSDADLKHFTRTSQYHPVAVVPTFQYQKTQATLDMGGLIPITQSVSGTDERQFVYGSEAFNIAWNQYRFGWDNFYMWDKIRKSAPATGGGWPPTFAYFIASGNPDDYYSADVSSMGETNIMPQSMAEYIYEIDYPNLGLTQKYEGQSWRAPKDPPWDAPYIYPTWNMKKPRDDQHGWFYYIEEAYYFTANPWIKDWYEFIKEFRKPSLDSTATGDVISSRGAGNMLSNALQAYRVTGDKAILDKTRNYINNRLRARQDSRYGFKNSLDGGNSEAGMQAGYLLRAVISYMEEIKDNDPQAYAEAFQFVSGYMEWNYNFSNFSYYLDASTGQIGTSDGTSLTLVDSQAWYYLCTGKQKYLDHLNQYINTGINGGAKPYGGHTSWYGQWEGRYSTYVRTNTKSDTVPPSKITDLAAARVGQNTMILVWTAPQDSKRYHIVWSNKPISENTTTDTNYTNWWAAKVIGPTLTATPGQKQQLTIQADQNIAKYFAIFTFDQNDNMSAMSNLAPVLSVIDQTGPTVPQNLSAVALSDMQISLSWSASSDPESGILKYNIYRNNTLSGESNTTSFADSGLSELTAYSYQVSAINGAAIESAKSEVISDTTKPDVTPPAIILVNSTLDPTKVTVVFSEPVDQTSATAISNYTISPPLSILSASLGADLKTVTLTTSIHTSGTNYTLSVSNVKDRARTPNTIASNSQKTYTYNPGLLVHWRFDEGSGATIADSSANSNSATAVNTPTWTQGRLNYALSFDGKAQYVRSDKLINTSNVTISAWIKISSIRSTNQMIVGFMNGPGSSTHDKELFVDTTGNLRFYVFSGGEKTTPPSAATIPLNQWVHVAATADGAFAKSYINGQEVASLAIPGDTYNGFTLPNVFVSGDNSPTPDITFFNGQIDEVRIYNRAFTQNEILTLYNEIKGVPDTTPPSPPTGLKVY